jgi:hypothetical protein
MAKPKQQLSDLDLLKQQAEDLWDQQQAVLAHARVLARAAGRQASEYTREVAPRVREVVSTGTGTVRTLAGSARDRIVHDVIPTVTGAAGTALATIDAFRDREVRSALSGLSRATRAVKLPVVVAPAPKPKVAPWVLLGLGVVAAGAVAYVVWQTLRADDELWIEDELPEAPTESAALPAEAE